MIHDRVGPFKEELPIWDSAPFRPAKERFCASKAEGKFHFRWTAGRPPISIAFQG